jgi:hypothetical protein
MGSALLDFVDLKARRILESAFWRWDEQAKGFRRSVRGDESTRAYLARQQMRPCPDVITFQELEVHSLRLKLHHHPIDLDARAEDLRWLRSRIKALSEKL